MTQNESEFKTSLRRKLVAPECNALIYAGVGSVFSIRGIPDWYVAHRIWRGWLELKDDKGKYSPQQENELRRLRSRGDVAFGLRRRGHNLFLEQVESDGRVVEASILVDYSGRSGVSILGWLRSI